MDEWNTWWSQWWVRGLLYGALATIGGVLGHIMRAVNTTTSITWGRAILEGLAAGFVGLLVMLMCSAASMSDQWTGVIVGVSGWLGANASIRMLEKRVFKQLGLDAPQDTKDAS